MAAMCNGEPCGEPRFYKSAVLAFLQLKLTDPFPHAQVRQYVSVDQCIDHATHLMPCELQATPDVAGEREHLETAVLRGSSCDFHSSARVVR